MSGMIKQLQLDRRKDDLINASPYDLRARTIRKGLNGLEHIEALMHIRGLDPEGIHVPRKNNRRFRNGALRTAVLDVLRQGLNTAGQIAYKQTCSSQS